MKRQISAPRGLWFIAVPGIALVVMPVLAVVWRTNYANFWTSISSESSRVALLLSLRTSIMATVLALIFGTPLAWLLANRQFKGRLFLRALCVLPMVLPPVVGGVALLFAFGRRSPIGGALDDWFGIQLAFTQTAA
ncbi:MAG: hypothetical protein RLZZ260_854, partial [Actinomycetota bacterium]